MTEKKRKILYWVFKILGIVVSCGLPIWAVCEKFPIWEKVHGTGHSVGAGAIIALIVLTVVFRKTVFDFLQEKLKLKHAPPIVVWLVLLVISYIMIYIGNFMQDLTTVLWMGLIGCAVGTFFTYLSERNGNGKAKSDE
jgi:O-antigen ligase